MTRMRSALMAGLALAIGSTLAYAAGNWSTLPIVGSDPFCGGTTSTTVGGTGTVCSTTIPAGPPIITGVELVPADTNLVGGAPPQTVTIPLALTGPLNAKINRLIGGDFATNLWQRGTSFASATPTTSTITADRWAVYSSGNTVTVNKQTGAGDSIPTSGLYASMRVVRPSGTDVTQICVGQTLDKQAASALIGNNAVFSVYALAGAGFSASVTGSNISVTIAYWTAADSATPLTNTDAFMKGTITGYTAVTAGPHLVSGGASTQTVGAVGSVTSAVASFPISTTWGRYSAYGTIPTTNTAGTAVTGVGVKVCYTPAAATTGGATEWFEIEGAQLQAMPATVSASLANGVTSPTGFERRDPATESLLQYRYTWGPGQETIGAFYVNGLCVATGNITFPFRPPVPMYIEPTTATSTLTAGTYSIQTAATVVGIGTMTITAAASENRIIALNSNAACTTTLPYIFAGGAGATGLVLFVAEP